MLCREIHGENEGCTQDIHVGDLPPWRHCPKCGRLTGHVKATAARFRVERDETTRAFLTLTNSGETPVQVSLTLEAEPGIPLSFAPHQNAQITVEPRRQTPVDVIIPPLQRSGRIGTLILSANDAPYAPHQDPWSEPECRQEVLALDAEVVSPAHIRPVQEILLFREGMFERHLHLVNDGDAPAQILQIRPPEGYDVLEPPMTLDGKRRCTYTIRRRPDAPLDQDGVVQIRVNPEQHVPLVKVHYEVNRDIAFPPAAIIGIDFGTAFTSIAFRECRYSTQMPDDVIFLRPFSETEDRYPSRIWIPRESGEPVCGSDATTRYNANPAGGFLFREIKTLLRDQSALHVYPGPQTLPDQPSAQQVARQRYGDNWPATLVTAYLSWLYQDAILPVLRARFGGPNADVKYVFSLPVLDADCSSENPGTQYNRQRDMMMECITRADFPVEQVQFEFEPVCASLGLLNPPPDAEEAWPHLGMADYLISENDTIAVFDSGGGTTDVVLAIVEVDARQNNRLSLRIEGCLGVGSSAETFGGEEVTEGILSGIEKPDVLNAPMDWFSGVIGKGHLFGDGHTDLEYRDSAETQVKYALSAKQPGEEIAINETVFRQSLLNHIVKPRLASIKDELKHTVFTGAHSPSRTCYYLSVGGNTYIPIMQRWVELFMGDANPHQGKRRLQLPEKYRKLAVAYGAVWVPDARLHNAMPYAIEVYAGQRQLVSIQRNQAQEGAGKVSMLTLPAGTHEQVTVYALFGDKRYRVAAGPIRNANQHSTTVRLVTDAQNGTLRVSFTDPAAPNTAPLSVLQYKV